MQFDSDKERHQRLDMAEKLVKKILDTQIVMSGPLFDSLVYTFTESQQWSQVIDLLNHCSIRNCKPELKTANYLKKNLLYCFEG